MSPKRIDQKFSDYQKALKRLQEAAADDPSKSSAILDGTIQRFEFTFEQAWKLLKEVLSYQGLEANNPRTIIKEAFKQKMIADGDAWIQALDDRNSTAHLYDEVEVKKIYERIKSTYLSLFETLLEKLTATIGNIKPK